MTRQGWRYYVSKVLPRFSFNVVWDNSHFCELHGTISRFEARLTFVRIIVINLHDLISQLFSIICLKKVASVLAPDIVSSNIHHRMCDLTSRLVDQIRHVWSSLIVFFIVVIFKFVWSCHLCCSAVIGQIIAAIAFCGGFTAVKKILMTIA